MTKQIQAHEGSEPATPNAAVELTTRLGLAHRDYLTRVYAFRDLDLAKAFQENLENVGIVKGPFLEVLPGYEPGTSVSRLFQDVLGTPMDAVTLKAITRHPSVYKHQESAVRRVAGGSNVVVSTGTGSGKTEAFLYPILLHLYDEQAARTLAEPGVRALILYPMNALANDQMDRLGRIAQALKDAGSPFQFTYGQYTGDTPEDEKDGARRAQEKEKARRPGQLVYRREIRDKPPHILLTNYSMLEYLLLRPEDDPLFSEGRTTHWRFLVVDEAHQYNGTKGAEVAFLLRRLKQRLRDGGRVEPFSCIATSATLSTSTDEDGEVAGFAEALFGEPFTAEGVIRGQKRPFPPPEMVHPASRPLLANDALRAFIEAASPRPLPVDDLARRLGKTRADVEGLASRVSTILDADTERPFYNIRYHFYFLEPQNLYVSPVPQTRVSFVPSTLKNGTWFSTALCRKCGSHFFEGEIRDGRFLETEAETYEEGLRVLHLEPEGPGETTHHVCLQCARIAQAGRPAPQCHPTHITSVKELSLGRTGSPTECPVCGAKSRSVIQTPRGKTLEAQAFLLQHLYESLPKGRDKVLTFADGRQNAANFAWESTLFSRASTYRGLLLEYGEQPDNRDAHPTVEDAALTLAGRFAQRFRPRESRVANEVNAFAFLLREFLRADDLFSLPNQGGMAAFLDLPEDLTFPTTEPPLPLSQADLRTLAAAMGETLFLDGAVDAGVWGRPIGWDELDLLFYQNEVQLGPPGGSKGIVSWNGPTGRRFDLARRFLEARGLPGTTETIDLTLRAIFETLSHAQSGRNGPILRQGKKGYLLDLRSIRLEFDPKQMAGCSFCRSRTRHGGLDVCPRAKCRGRLQPIPAIPQDLADLYQASATKHLVIEEHTAQIDRTLANQYQTGFANGEIGALSSSTTFELGVDLGDLDVVYLRNFPPEPFNYAQRAGRVGRRPGSPGYVFVYAKRGSHDSYHYHRPDRMLAGEVEPPVIDLSNALLLGRHVNAVVLAEWFRANDERFDALSDLLGERPPFGLCEELSNFIEANKDRLLELLTDSFGSSATTELLGELLEQLPAKDDRLDAGVQEVAGDLASLEAVIAAATKERDFKTAQWAADRESTILAEKALTWLSRKVVIPKYGFPVDVVRLDPQTSDLRHEISLDRDLQLALTEYGPGRYVTANKRAWRSDAVKVVKERKLHRAFFSYCEEHGTFDEVAAAPNTGPADVPELKCACSDLRSGLYLVPQYGFLARPDSARSPTQIQNPVYSTTPLFAGLNDANAMDEWRDLAGGRIGISTASPGRIIVLAHRPNGARFSICSECGLGLPSAGAAKSHLPPNLRNGTKGQHCKGTPEEVALAHRFTTMVLRLRFHPSQFEGQNLVSFRDRGFLEGVATALSLAAAEILSVPSYEIGHTVSYHADAEGFAQIVLFDTAPGGAGLVDRLGEDRFLLKVVQQTVTRVSGECGCATDASCYGCLRTFKNQTFHSRIQRGPVLALATEILGSWGSTSRP